MPSPSTHQDSPKVPEDRVTAFRHLQNAQNALEIASPSEERIEDARREIAAANRLLQKGYIPASALLSDEAKRALAAFDDHGDYEAPVQALRDLLAVIEQVGGAE